jgi:rhamnogalacturonyl hydrolase YesR
MKKLLFPLIFITLMLISCSGDDIEDYIPPEPIPPEEPVEPVAYHTKAKELFDLINQFYGIRSGAAAGLYNENYPKKSGDNIASYLWPYDGLVSGAALLHELSYDVKYTDLVDNFDLYYRPSAGNVNIGGYGSSTNGTTGGGTRFYDDNSIVGISLVEAYKLTDNSNYLAKAKQIVQFLKSGEDNIHGGGLWWNESEKNISGNENSNKPTCSNGYATLFLLEYYTVCDQSEKSDVLAFAKRLYTWVYNNLRDPADGCYWNDVQVSGVVNKTKWTYNTGVMISNGIRLSEILNDQKYLNEAIESAQGAYSYFVRPAGNLALAYPNHDPWFTTKLIRSFVDIEPYYPSAANYIKTFINFLDYGYTHARFSNGLFYEDWTGSDPKRAEQLLMQAAVLESLGVVALYKGESANAK